MDGAVALLFSAAMVLTSEFFRSDRVSPRRLPYCKYGRSLLACTCSPPAPTLAILPSTSA